MSKSKHCSRSATLRPGYEREFPQRSRARWAIPRVNLDPNGNGAVGIAAPGCAARRATAIPLQWSFTGPKTPFTDGVLAF